MNCNMVITNVRILRIYLRSKRLKICQKAAILKKKELSTSVDWKAARSQRQSQQIRWETLSKVKNGACKVIRIEEESKDFFQVYLKYTYKSAKRTLS